MTPMNPERFLHQRDPNLQKSEAVEKAVSKRDRLNRFKKETADTDLSEAELEALKKTPNTPEARIEAYISRLENIFLNETPERRKRNLELLRPYIYEEFVIKKEDIPESYWNLQRKIARERGESFPDEIPESLKDDAYEILSSDQKESLDYWMEYLSSSDALYESWFKFFVMKSVLGLADFDKKEHKFPKRTKSTTGPFPDLNQEALATTEDYFIRRLSGESIENPIPEPENPYADEQKPVSDEEFQVILSSENFARYYAFTIEHVVADSKELWPEIDGEWKVFSEGQETELVQSLQGKGTGWCTAGVNTATTQLENGDFHVYYSKDKLGVPSVPRLAIRMEYDRIAEVRGVAQDQNIDPFIAPILEEKMGEFGKQGEVYKKKAEDMSRLTNLDNRHQKGEELSSDDLRFLYEMEGSIKSFAQFGGKDPRIKEIVETRDFKTDMAIIFEEQDDNQLVKAILDAGKYHIISKFTSKISDFSNLSPEIAVHLLESKDEQIIRAVSNNLKSFVKFDGYTTVALLKTGLDFQTLGNNLEKIPALDSELAALLLSGGKNCMMFLVTNLDKFESLDHQDTAYRLLDSFGADGAEILASNFDKFSGLDQQSTMMRLIDRIHNGAPVGAAAFVKNIDKFEDPSVDVAIRLLQVKDSAGRLVGDKFFEEISERISVFNIEFAKQLLEIDTNGKQDKLFGFKILTKYVNKFENFDTDLALSLLEIRDNSDSVRPRRYAGADFLAENLDKIQNLNGEFALRLLDKANGAGVLVKNIDKFNDLDHRYIVNRILDSSSQYGLRAVANNLDKLVGIDFEDVTLHLLDKLPFDFSWDISKLQNPSSKIALRLMHCADTTRRKLSENLGKFHGLDTEFAIALLERDIYGHGSEVLAENIDKFEGINFKDIALRMIEIKGLMNETYGASHFVNNIDKFEGLDTDVALRLLEVNAEYLALVIDKFEGLDHQDIANRFIDAGKGWTLLRHLDKFPDLNHQDIANRLIEMGRADFVREGLHFLKGLSEETLRRSKLLESKISAYLKG
ncbi:MAG: hypothetical protein RL538_653 [Candidatus Parcubacteria bacterium]|jgi:hypothetical protein